ncbi:Glucanosyltransferase-domain-containing protein [Cryomyces antarcticus]
MISLPTIVASLALSTAAHALNPIDVRGQDFIDTVTKNRFVIVGIDYQPGGQGAYNPTNSQDPLSNGTVCLRDAALMQSLGINTIRTYNVDPSLNHDDCASVFNEAGIYMIVDVNAPLAGESIDRSNPGSSYTLDYLTRIFGVVEAFKNYPNTLGFFAANEVVNDVPTAKTNPPYMRAVQRDLKDYIAAHSSRPIPVGYSAADVREVLQDTWAYLQCAINGSSSDTSRADFFGLNSYSWCSGGNYQTASYGTLVSMFGNSTIPVFFSEYGCNKPEPRTFDEVLALYGSQMTVLSGGLVYEYSQEPSNFGLVDLYDNGTVQLRTDYDNLQAQYNKLNVTLLETSNASATALSPPACSSGLITSSSFSTNCTIPQPPAGAAALISSGISNPNNGKIVPVANTAVPMAVYASNGGLISGLALKPVNGSNTPNGANTGGSASISSGPSGTSTAAASATRTMLSDTCMADVFGAYLSLATSGYL